MKKFNNAHSPAWLIDSSIYVFKSWYTYPEHQDLQGNSVNAVIGFIEFASKLLERESPEMIGFAFDESLETSHRREIYPAYKANRASAPESLRFQFKQCRAFLEAMGIHQAASNKYEADDLLGTWAKHFSLQSRPTYIISADKDLAQLVTDIDYWWEYQRGEPMDTKKITKRFGIKPEQIAEQLAISGDKSDNIPGVPGIGLSTAAKLLRRFGSIENLLSQIEEVSTMQIRGAKRIQQLIRAHQDTILLSHKLTKIVDTAAVVESDDFKIKRCNADQLRKLCYELNLPDETAKKWISLNNNLCNT